MGDRKEMEDGEFLEEECGEVIKKDYELLNVRNKVLKDKESFVREGSYVDLGGYLIYKECSNMGECEVDGLLDIWKDVRVEECDLLIQVGLSMQNMKEWGMEENKKRMINRYYEGEM